MKRNADHTQYPDLYAQTNWGQLDEFSTDAIEELIINNRNSFVTDYRIKQIQHRENWPNYISYEYLDSGLIDRGGELYINSDNQYVLLVSFTDLSLGISELLEERGFIPVYPLYHKDDFSFIKILERTSKGHRRKFID